MSASGAIMRRSTPRFDDERACRSLQGKSLAAIQRQRKQSGDATAATPKFEDDLRLRAGPPATAYKASKTRAEQRERGGFRNSPYAALTIVDGFTLVPSRRTSSCRSRNEIMAASRGQTNATAQASLVKGSRRRLNMTVRLLAGIVTTSCNAKPDPSASGTTSVSRQRTPQRGSRARKSSSNVRLEGAVSAPSLLKGPYRINGAVSVRIRAEPLNSPSAASQGAIWIMLAQKTASAD